MSHVDDTENQLGTSGPAADRPLTVVFDLGGVVVNWDPYMALADRLDRAGWADFSAAIDFPGVNLAMDAGLTHAAARERVAAAHPEHAATFARYCENFAGSLTGPVPGTDEVIDELAAAGVPLLGLTNWSAETFVHARPAAPAIGRLHGVVVSGEEGVVKPDPAIFEILITRYALDPARTVFIDDSPGNVRGAEAVGLTALRFTGADRLRDDLRALGLPVRLVPRVSNSHP
ncbi:HAD-IA family hydrolase [Georgenia ruanii]|uniref:HAD-IA family hydrolase n=1 Tax=Georgenia ruanii TaxID=348442 RepID=A0A7J9UVS1_9MICO|nr:HAD-IA family hydrolase [Georgenia ruanii]MPV88719.1 HAD-IA family hydrolase [Georgenia ruanii]